MIDLILVTIGVIGLIIASLTDIKKREVPDWLNYFLIGTGLGLRLISSLTTHEWFYFLYGVIGFAVFLALSYLMFYTGQWGGGDSKMLMGLGAIFATYPAFLLKYFSPLLKFPFLIIFLVNLLLVGAIYGLIYSLVLAYKNREKFSIEMKKILSVKKVVRIRKLILLFSLLLIIAAFLLTRDFLFLTLILLLTILFILTFYVWIFTKVVEKACMLKYVHPEKLTEGDWIAENVVIDGNLICGPKDLGIEKKQIAELIELKKQKKIDKILVKDGIPFVPSFLIAIIISLVFGNWIFLFI